MLKHAKTMQLFPLRFIPLKPNFGFMRMRNANLIISCILCLLSFIHIGIFNFNYGIDFAGGITIEVKTDQEPDLAKIRNLLADLALGEVSIQSFGTTRDLSIRISATSAELLQQNVNLVKQTFKDNLPYNIDYRKIDMVGPQVGNEMIKSGATAMILAFVAIMIYVWVRFEWQFGVGVLLSLVHDVILSLGFMSFTGYDFNLSTVAAILTIIGYSVNDSVVIYDRIRENLRKKFSNNISKLIDDSINETLSRTTITVITTLMANLALIIWGGEAIRSFSSLVFFGVFVGAYSSIFVSAPILTIFKFKSFSSNQNIKQQ